MTHIKRLIASFLLGAICRTGRVMRAKLKGTALRPRVRPSFPLLLGAVVLTAVAAAPVGASAQPIQHSFAAHARPDARSPRPDAWIGSDPLSLPRPSGPGALTARSGFGSALVGTAPVGNGPALLAVDPDTHTIYVANGENNNGPSAGGDTVSVIDARQCDALNVSRCQGPWPTITVGNGTVNDLPSGIAIDRKTDTVYVTNVGDNTVSVFNGATCNATDTNGCGQAPAEVPVGSQPLNLYADSANHTVYVVNSGAKTVSMIDSATCNATDLSACPTTRRPSLSVRAQPLAVDVDQVTHTVYVTTAGTGAQNGWAVFNAGTCNAVKRSGCHSLGKLIGNPAGPNDGQVDAANDTLYTANYTNTISVFDLRHCWAGDLAGCAADKPGIVTPFPDPGFQEESLNVAVDQPLHSVYVSLTKDATLAVVDTSVCNGRHLAACARLRTPSIHTGAAPQGVVLDSSTQTLYTANEVDNDISVIAASKCNANYTAGCRHPAPSVPLSSPGALATDSAVHTAYVTNGNDAVAMINTARCNAYRLTDCGKTPAQFNAGKYGTGVAIDPVTHTVYVADYGAGSTGTVAVIDDRTCNAAEQTGCRRQRTLRVPGGNPDGILVNPANDTVYVTTITRSGPNLISVFKGATCNATHSVGCSQRPAVLQLGQSAGGDSDLYIALNQHSQTLYATNVDYNTQTADSVYVINAATCDAEDIVGCKQIPATVTVGDDPRGLAVDPATDTIYVVNHAAGDYAATVSVINGATCNGTTTVGCNQKPATVAVGFGAVEAAIDPGTHRVYTTNLHDTSVSVINVTICNATETKGCNRTPAAEAVGNYPYWIAVDPAAGTAYVADINNVSVVALGGPERPRASTER
jgi:YVTN family beta-propeller protein